MWKQFGIFHITDVILAYYKHKCRCCILLYLVTGCIRDTTLLLCGNPAANVALIAREVPYHSSCGTMVRLHSQQKPAWLQHCIKNRHGLPQIQTSSLLFRLTDRPPRSWFLILLTDMQTPVESNKPLFYWFLFSLWKIWYLFCAVMSDEGAERYLVKWEKDPVKQSSDSPLSGECHIISLSQWGLNVN